MLNYILNSTNGRMTSTSKAPTLITLPPYEIETWGPNHLTEDGLSYATIIKT